MVLKKYPLHETSFVADLINSPKEGEDCSHMYILFLPALADHYHTEGLDKTTVKKQYLVHQGM